jgi:hypothetical protein
MIQNILDKLRAQDTVPVQITSLFPNLNYSPQFGHLTFHVSKEQGTFEAKAQVCQVILAKPDQAFTVVTCGWLGILKYMNWSRYVFKVKHKPHANVKSTLMD